MDNLDEDSLVCHGKHCRRMVDPGKGVQIISPDGSYKRYCRRCWLKICDVPVISEMKR